MNLRSTDWLASGGDAYSGGIISCEGWELEREMRGYIFDVRVAIKEIMEYEKDSDIDTEDMLQTDGTCEI